MYVDELRVKDAETCPAHSRVLRCPEQGCGHASQRTAFDHKAAAYAFDRLLGRPTTRSENALTVRFIQEITDTLVAVFNDVNGIGDPDERRTAFAERLIEVGRAYEAGSGF